MKRKGLMALCAALVLSLAISFAGAVGFAAESFSNVTALTNWTADAAYSESGGALVYNGTNGSALLKRKPAADSTVKFVLEGDAEANKDVGWAYGAIGFKMKNASADPTTAQNGLYIVWGNDTWDLKLMKCVPVGESVLVAKLDKDELLGSWNFWSSTSGKPATIEIATKDEADGVQVDITASFQDENVKLSAKVEDLSLLGEGYISVRFWGDAMKMTLKEVGVSAFAPDPIVYEDVRALGNWTGTDKASFGNDAETGNAIYTGTAGTSNLVLNRIAARDSALKVSVKGDKDNTTTWAYGIIGFRMPAEAANPAAADDALYVKYGHDAGVKLFKRVGGVETELASKALKESTMFWNGNETLTFEIETAVETDGLAIKVTALCNWGWGNDSQILSAKVTEDTFKENVGVSVGFSGEIIEKMTFSELGVSAFDSVNFAASKDGFRPGKLEDNVMFFNWDDDGLMSLQDINQGAVMLYPSVKSGQRMDLQITSSLEHDPTKWADMILLFKNTNEDPLAREYGHAGWATGTPTRGNWLGLEIGTDGIYRLACKDGKVEKTAFTTDSAFEVVKMFYTKGRTTNISVLAEDTETGVRITATIAGGTGTVTETYTVENPALKGDSAASLQFTGSLPGTSDGYFAIDKWTLAGVETFAPEISSETLAGLNADLADSALEALTVGKDNVADCEAKISQIEATYAKLTYGQTKTFSNYKNLSVLRGKVTAYRTAETSAAAAVALIEALPETVTAANYQSAKTAIEAAEAAYNALDAAGKAMVTNTADLTAARAALDAYESALRVAEVQSKIDALAETVNADNSEAVKAAIEAAETAIGALTSGEQAKLDKTKLTSAKAALEKFENERDKKDEEKGCGSIGSFGNGTGALLLLAVIGIGAIAAFRRRRA